MPIRSDTAPDDDDPYAESVDPRVSCDTCEAVCCRLTVYLMPGDDVPPWLVGWDEHGLEQMAKEDDGWCVALDRNTMRCTIYANRPAVCRSFATGGPYCRDERDTWFGAPGAGIPIRVLDERV
ncbi:MAG TPA: YkgJ family cysteine cluster protein [Dokdonella sp.]